MEDSACFGPVALEAATLKVLVATLEQEVVGNQLLSVGLAHVAKGVVFALEFSVELLEDANNLGLDLKSLLTSAGGSKWVVGQVTANTNSSGVDHLVFVSGEVRAVQLVVVHVGDVLVAGAMAVIVLDDLVEERGECIVSFVTSGIYADAGVGPLATREDALLESISEWVLFVLALFPDVTGEGLGEQRGGAGWEIGEFGDLSSIGEMTSHHHAVGVSLSKLVLQNNKQQV